jgi:LmbE family N-acetylglucosaminyl deacetylase
MIEQLKRLAPIPDPTDAERFLFVGPHPDDIEVGAGAFVASLTDRGKIVDYVIVTDGGAGDNLASPSGKDLTEIRETETRSAAEAMGVHELCMLDYEDGTDYDAHDVARDIAKKILKWDPDVVVCPDPTLASECHPDHIKTGQAVRTAVLMASYPAMLERNDIFITKEQSDHIRPRTIAHYFTDKENSFVPVDDEHLARMQSAIAMHESQFPAGEERERLMAYLGMKHRMWGEAAGEKQAIGLFVLAPVHQHCFPDVFRY